VDKRPTARQLVEQIEKRGMNILKRRIPKQEEEINKTKEEKEKEIKKIRKDSNVIDYGFEIENGIIGIKRDAFLKLIRHMEYSKKEKLKAV
jgi:hypothetical protein